MREILFRGKRLDNGEWVTGAPFIAADCCKMICAVAVHPDFVDEGNVYFSEGFPVVPETVGQFTGLTDKNGNRAFEHDVIKHHFGDEIGVIRYGEYRNPFGDDNFGGHVGFYVDWVSGEAPGALRKDLGYWMRIVVILGNIHDHPELLGGNNDNALQ